MANLTRTGTLGLELTREEVIEAKVLIDGILRKAQCREVNCDVIDNLEALSEDIGRIDTQITEILESEE